MSLGIALWFCWIESNFLMKNVKSFQLDSVVLRHDCSLRKDHIQPAREFISPSSPVLKPLLPILCWAVPFAAAEHYKQGKGLVCPCR